MISGGAVFGPPPFHGEKEEMPQYKYEELEERIANSGGDVRYSFVENDIPDLPLLRKHVEWVEEQAAKGEDRALGDHYWDQGSWGMAYLAKKNEQEQIISCKTGCCLAGNVAMQDPDVTLLIEDNEIWGVRDAEGQMWSIAGYAGSKLGLAITEGGIFAGGNDAEDIRAYAESIAERAGEVL